MNTAIALQENDEARASAEPRFQGAHVSELVWRQLLLLRQSKGKRPLTGWCAEEHAAWDLYAPLAGPVAPLFVFAQIGQSLDGRIATESGDAQNISGRDGLKHLHRCRALADVVVVGVNTVLADDPRLTVRLVEGDSPARAIIDPHGRLPDDCPLFAADGRTIVLRRSDTGRPSGVESVAVPSRAGRLDPQAIIEALGKCGFRTILIEGGATTIGHFLDAGVLDRLHVSIAPLLIGAGPAGLKTSPVQTLTEARRPETRVYGLGTDIIFDCDLNRATC